MLSRRLCREGETRGKGGWGMTHQHVLDLRLSPPGSQKRYSARLLVSIKHLTETLQPLFGRQEAAKIRSFRRRSLSRPFLRRVGQLRIMHLGTCRDRLSNVDWWPKLRILRRRWWSKIASDSTASNQVGLGTGRNLIRVWSGSPYKAVKFWLLNRTLRIRKLINTLFSKSVS